MGTLIGTFLVITGLLTVLAAPLWIVSWRKGELASKRNYLLAALGVGLFCGAVAAAGERQVQQCLDAGNHDCVDAGTPGLQLVFIVIYVAVVWVMAYVTWRE
ncbi:MAG TPA: hypothetical protein VI141_02630 [Acidimicrobiia bacterium]